MSNQRKKCMTGVDIVREYLEQNGFDGLCHAETECGCHLQDFFICGENLAECEPAYKFEKSNGDWWMSTDKSWQEQD